MKTIHIVPVKPLVAAMIVLTANTGKASNLVANGDFENNTSGITRLNLSNASFSGYMPDVTPFGELEALDIVTGVDFGLAPQSGSWKVGISRDQFGAAAGDAFTMTLSSSASSGAEYTLDFYTAQLSGSPAANLRVSISSSATSEGLNFITYSPLSATSTSSWTHHTVTFTAANSGQYLAFRDVEQGAFAFIDNVSLTAIPEPGSFSLIAAGMVGFAVLRRRFV